jgi:hypothetical protein
MLDKRIIDITDIESLVLGKVQNSGTKESRTFVTTRLQVMFDNMILGTECIDAFDYLSKLLLDLNEKVFKGKK